MTNSPMGVEGEGSVTASAECTDRIQPRTDGPVLEETREALETGIGGEDPLPPPVLDGVVEQAERIISRVLGSYERLVAPGEVGPEGSGDASDTAPISDQGATGLLYGKVQSGKTLAMIMTAALAMDNGFRIVIVLTSDNVKLVEQTAGRFSALQGALVRSSDSIGSWMDDPEHAKLALRDKHLVLVTAKNVSRLSAFCQFLAAIGATEHPALILDDEADQASLDTNTRKRAKAENDGDLTTLAPSKIFDWTNGDGTTVQKNGKRIDSSIRAALPHHVYLQVTATPYALLLQNMDSLLRPTFTELLEPGEGYVGGDFFFSSESFQEGKATPLVFVDESEAEELLKGRSASHSVPEGLDLALGTFLAAATAQAMARPKMKFAAQNFLVHTSAKKAEHNVAADCIRARLGLIYELSQTGERPQVLNHFLMAGIAELSRTVEQPPSLDDVLKFLKKRFHDREVLVVNSDKDAAKFGPRLNFIVGGNILGRGLTIKNLLVTYYLRSAKVAQMDTMLQHARMFGYRAADKNYLRAFLPELQAARFARIQRTESELREALEVSDQRAVTVEVEKGLRATRLGVLDPYNVEAYRPGEHLYPTMPLIHRRPGGVDDLQKSEKAHQAAFARFKETFLSPDDIGELFGSRGKLAPEMRKRGTSVGEVIEALSWLPVPASEGERGASWAPRVLRVLLEAAAQRLGEKAYVYCRSAKRQTITEGMLSSQELKLLRGWEHPVLCVFWDDSRDYEKRKGNLKRVVFPYLFPEIVMPMSLPGRVVNVDGLSD